MSPHPAGFLGHLREHGYHPRSDKHSNSLGTAIAHDLVACCPSLRSAATNGSLAASLNFTLRAGTADWNVDLVLGPPASPRLPNEGGSIAWDKPARVQIAIEIKSVMTEHRKAVKNRKRDLEAHHEHVHNYDEQAIAGAVLVINGASEFTSPLRSSRTIHRNPTALVQHCVDELRSVATRGGKTGYGLEAACAIVLDMDNHALGSTDFIQTHPAPEPGDPLHYDAFIQAICEHYRRRFG